MSDHTSDVNREHNVGGDGNGSDQNEEKHVEVKTITTIYYDVLDRIFDFLDMEDLLNVADTCKRLHIAAQARFGELIQTEDTSDSCSIYPSGVIRFAGIAMAHSSVEVCGLKFCLQFLRCFGAKVSTMKVLMSDTNAWMYNLVVTILA